MAVASEDAETFMKYAAEENLEATIVATVTEEKRMREVWNGKTIVDLSREFLNSNGAERHASARILPGHVWQPAVCRVQRLSRSWNRMVSDLNVCTPEGSGRALRLHHRRRYRADALRRQVPADPHTWLWPPSCPLTAKQPTCSGMAWGFNPYLTEADPYRGAYMAVVESVTKLVCAGFHHEDMLPDLPGIF